MPFFRRLAPMIGVLSCLLVFAAAPPLPAQHTQRGRLVPIDGTDAGVWDGTWYYSNRDMRSAIWLRTVNGKTELMLQYLHTGTAESFGTDWQGQARYPLRSGEATFSLEILEGDANTLRAKWDWRLAVGAEVRHETAHIDIYRTGEGRMLVMLFDGLERYVKGRDREYTLPLEQSWTFRKASSRLVRWQEMPF